MGCWISPWPPLHIAGYLPMGIFPNHDRLSGKCGLATPSRTGVRFFHLGIRQNLGTVKGVNGWTCEIFLARDARKTYDHRQANLRARGLFAKDEFSGHNRRLEAVGWCGDRHFMISCLWSWFRCKRCIHPHSAWVRVTLEVVLPLESAVRIAVTISSVKRVGALPGGSGQGSDFKVVEQHLSDAKK